MKDTIKRLLFNRGLFYGFLIAFTFVVIVLLFSVYF